MARSPYKDFSNYMLRYYLKTQETEICTEVEKLNWQAAKAAIDELGERSKGIVKFILIDTNPIQESVYRCREETGVSEPEIWSILKKLYRRTAEIRGLI